MINYGSLPIHTPQELYVIADIHGEHERLDRLLDLIIPELTIDNHLVFCGDYTGHNGISSPKVLLKLVEIKKLFPKNIFFIRGNHEDMMWKTLNRKFMWFLYTKNTLKQMMLEWEILHSELKPMSYISEIFEECDKRGITDFYKELLPYYETDSVICTHAPLDKIMCGSYGLSEYNDEFKLGSNPSPFLDRMNHELTWGFTNEDPPYSTIDISKILVCGHQFKRHKQPRKFEDRVFLDTGCGVNVPTPLVALKLPEKRIIRESY